MWANRPVSEMTTSNSPPAALLTQLVLFHRSRCWFCFSEPMKSAWSGVSLKLLENYKHFFWSSPDVLTISPLLPCPPFYLPISVSFCFRPSNVFAEGVSPESLGHSSSELSQRLLATVLRSQWPRREELATYSERHKASSANQKRCVQWVWLKKGGQLQKKSQTDTNNECTALESTWSKRTAVLNISLSYVQSFSAFCMIWRPHLSIIFLQQFPQAEECHDNDMR